jgi:predicted RNA-binding Zn ribbon-like protein
MSPKAAKKTDALFLAGHLALDFLNSREREDDGLADLLQSDEDVLSWLEQAGYPAPDIGHTPRRVHLLSAARTLRESIRSLVEMRKDGKRGNPSVLNHFLATGRSYRQLVWSKSNELKIDTVRKEQTAESILAPVAEAAADLLAMADFALVKRCENTTCGLWFYDQTRSHRRRWCSMQRCGNRHKVAAYRTRRRKLDASDA